jgi:hypothetical protein
MPRRSSTAGSGHDCLGRIHQPLPPWLTIRISPLLRRYLRLSFVLSFRSSFHASGLRSSTTAQWTLSRNSSISGSCLVTVAPHAEVQERSFLALVPSLPCPRRQPQDGQAARARGTRGSLRRILVGADGVSGNHYPLLRISTQKLGGGGATGNHSGGQAHPNRSRRILTLKCQRHRDRRLAPAKLSLDGLAEFPQQMKTTRNNPDIAPLAA